VKFLVDNNLSPLLAESLTAQGHDAIHLRDLGMQAAPDEVVLARAAAESRVLVSADTDFGGLLARSKAASPSVLLIRRLAGRRAAEQSAIIRANLDQVTDDVAETSGLAWSAAFRLASASAACHRARSATTCRSRRACPMWSGSPGLTGSQA
jgi:predicted nuclease of predicted toxin-antitoxin system